MDPLNFVLRSVNETFKMTFKLQDLTDLFPLQPVNRQTVQAINTENEQVTSVLKKYSKESRRKQNLGQDNEKQQKTHF